MSDTPFEVTDEIETGDMSDVQADLLPAASKVLFVIKKVSVDSVPLSKEDKTPVLKKIRLQAKLVDGVEVAGESKYKGKVSFIDLTVWHSPEHKTSQWYTSRKYLLPYKQFIIGMGYDAKQSPKINDELLSSWVDREFRADIKQVPIQAEEVVTDDEGNQTKKWVDTSDLKNEYRNFRAA